MSGEHGLLAQRGRGLLDRCQEYQSHVWQWGLVSMGETAGCTRCLVAMVGDLEKFGLAGAKALIHWIYCVHSLLS